MQEKYGLRLSFISNNQLSSAKSLGLVACHVCGLVSHLPKTVLARNQLPLCARCNATLHSRKPKSLSRSWALLITAYMLYIPANVLPIMDTSSLFNAQRDTIMSGIIYLWRSGSWSLALLVFFASIVTPLFKMIALTFLLLSIQFKNTWHPLQRTSLYRFLKSIGRWSMLDIYMVAILVKLVQVKSLTVINASPGALVFAGVVVLTMLAVETFDPRLIWDSALSDKSLANKNQSNQNMQQEKLVAETTDS